MKRPPGSRQSAKLIKAKITICTINRPMKRRDIQMKWNKKHLDPVCIASYWDSKTGG
jgi:hypothetical protein